MNKNAGALEPAFKVPCILQGMLTMSFWPLYAQFFVKLFS